MLQRVTPAFEVYGGCFVPELLVEPLQQLEHGFAQAWSDNAFRDELATLLRDYAGRPTPLYRCRNLGREFPADIFLKREDLVHGGAHKTNQAIGQAMLAVRLGKRRLIAETGAGQHGVATAMVGSLFGLETVVYMGARDMARQQPNVRRMELFGAEVRPVHGGRATLKEALGDALREWAHTFEDTHYLIGTAAGPHPYPTMVRELQRVIGEEALEQIRRETGGLPAEVVACVGGGSNAIGIFAPFIAHRGVRLTGVEAAGHGLSSGRHAATLTCGSLGILHGARTKVLASPEGLVIDAESIAAGLDYPAVGPEHVALQASGRAQYVAVSDEEALAACRELARCEGILPALESSHAIAHALDLARNGIDGPLLVNLSGRGDKDLHTLGGAR